MSSIRQLTSNNETSRYRGFIDIGSDTRLLSRNSSDTLDVWVNSRGRVQLRKLSFWERVVLFFYSDLSEERMCRFRAYINTVYNRPLQIDTDAQKQFYKLLRQKCKWVDLSKLSPEIIQTLSPALFSASAIAQKALPNSLEHWRACVLEVHLANELGIVPVSAGGGVNNAQFCLGLNGKPLTVIKTQAKDKRLINERTFGFRTQLEICGHNPLMAGAVAAKADKHFDFCLVPHTDLDSQDHSHQIFVDQTVDASKAKFKGKLLKDRPIEDFDPEELDLLRARAFFNYLIGDIDTKDDKLRMRLDQGKITEIYETDNDNGLPSNPLSSKDWPTLRKTYFWRKHEWAQHTRCVAEPGSRLREILMRVFDHNQVIAFVDQMNEEFPGFLIGTRLQLLLERIAILKAAVQLKIPLADLGSIYGMECCNPQNRFGHLKERIDHYKNNPHENPLQPIAAPSTGSSPSLITSVFNWCVSWVY